MSNSITSNLHASQFLFKRVNLEPWMRVYMQEIKMNCNTNIEDVYAAELKKFYSIYPLYIYRAFLLIYVWDYWFKST